MYFEREKTGKRGRHLRSVVLCVLAIAFTMVYVLRLGDLQILNYEIYSTKASASNSQKVKVKAARGEILDRYGRPIAINRDGYDIVLDKSYLPENNDINKTLITLVNLLTEYQLSWRDELPITTAKPYEFDIEEDSEFNESNVNFMRSKLKLNHYATAENCVDAMIEKYELEQYVNTDLFRTLLGIRYTMDAEDFSVSYPYTFAHDISENVRTKLKESSDSLKGVTISSVPVREYVDDTIAPHIIGTVGPIYAEDWEGFKAKGYSLDDTVGKSGVELAFEEYLKGADGYNRIVKNADGTVETIVETEAVPGNTVMLSLDLNLQKTAQSALKQVILDINKTQPSATAGAMAVVDIHTGDVLASATYPTYTMTEYEEDYESLIKDKRLPLFNRAFNGTYQPGSTFKPGVAATGLTLGKITKDETIYCSSIYNINGMSFRCMGYHGSETVVDALSHSCNVFFYELGNRIGISSLNSYCRKLGLGVKTGVEIGESAGVLSGPEYAQQINAPWYIGDTIQSSIGQLYNLFTPLQLATYTATIANGGTRYQTRLLNQVKSYDLTQTVKSSDPIVAAETELSKDALDTVKQGMLSAALDGTAASVFGKYTIEVGGKTGTAQNQGDDHGVFISFAPYDNPEIAVAIVVEHGLHGYVTAPAVKSIYDTYFFSKSEPETVANIGTLKQ